MGAVFVATGTHPDGHLITGLLEEFAVCQRRFLGTLSTVLEADWAAPLGFSAESGCDLIAGHGSGEGIVGRERCRMFVLNGSGHRRDA